ncbi:hypothetical protein BU25DRAFT_130796 [Macroventuria anomochaeta]|uniref:Uncharacterized protein n=1 Tax=Macroventuria anomochaeta TaxID=301207 RepID=A0ACB6RTG5_9PLEO|nr:uncharacterized protein BU25DRAFT_130796 [Macroventuria anomochaeta]KAF2625018.1 hypothetical protein BU25DRAFT_130796 [Macroventuria anomochaeta]
MKQSETKRKCLSSEPLIAGGHQGNAKLSKPPKVENLHERPRNRLQKQGYAIPSMLTPYPAHLGFTTPTATLYVLEYEPYPYNTLPSEFLGVYLTVDSVTAGAVAHGAYTFSREGLLDGSEYLNPTGRIKIQSQLVQQSGTDAQVSIRSHSLDERPAREDGLVRSDIPHPDYRSNTLSKTARPDVAHPGAQSMTSLKIVSKPKDTVYLAIRRGPTAAHCLGVYARPSLAWGACLKNKASCAISGTLSEESRDVDADGMPRATARLHGCGQHMWFVVAKEVDATAR